MHFIDFEFSPSRIMHLIFDWLSDKITNRARATYTGLCGRIVKDSEISICEPSIFRISRFFWTNFCSLWYFEKSGFCSIVWKPIWSRCQRSSHQLNLFHFRSQWTWPRLPLEPPNSLGQLYTERWWTGHLSQEVTSLHVERLQVLSDCLLMMMRARGLM